MKKLAPDTPIAQTNLSIVDFWAWAYSDILSNANRGVLAEFLVGAALGVISEARIEWDAQDLIYGETKIEVKSSAYLQSWEQKALSKIVFDIAPKLSWNASTNTYANVATRAADIYVFGLFAEQDESKANVLDTSQWKFYILPTNVINQQLGQQKTISLNPLRKLSSPVTYTAIRKTVDSMI